MMGAKASFSALLLVVLAAGCGEANRLMTCHSCAGINCQRTGLARQQKCVDSLDYCVTIYEQSEVLYKGCSLEIPKELRPRCEAPHGDACFKCNSDGCNNVGAAKFACIQCDSTKDSDCAENAIALKPAVCPAPTAANSYCFVRASSSGGAIQRGCATTLTDQQSCLKDANCLLCSAGDIRACNSADIAFDSSAGNRFIRFLR